MKRAIIALLSLLVLVAYIGCTTDSSVDDAQNEGTDLVSPKASDSDGTVRTTDSFEWEDWDVVMHDDDDWYFFLDYQSSRGRRTFIYRGYCVAVRGSREYSKEAFMVYDDETQTLCIGTMSPFNETDYLLYTTEYDPSALAGFDFNGSYGWRDYGYGYRLHLKLDKGSFGTISAKTTAADSQIIPETKSSKRRIEAIGEEE